MISWPRIFSTTRDARIAKPSLRSSPSAPKKCMGRVKYFSRNLMVRMSNITRNVRPRP